jgi:hypothetical protein
VSVDHPSSVYHLIIRDVIPSVPRLYPGRKAPIFAVLNTGAVRFDLFRGPFTIDTRFLVLPFENQMLFIRSVPTALARSLVNRLNSPERARVSAIEREPECGSEWRADVARQWARWSPKDNDEHLSYGYVTVDECPGSGDDTQHRPSPRVDIPEYVSSPLPRDEDSVDLVFLVGFA